jgi:GTP-binding protein EngB required for normal cell division
MNLPESQQSAAQAVVADDGLLRLAEIASEFGAEQIATNARSIAERIAEGRFYVACVGQFKRGKSTLLNALVGSPVLPMGVIPVTAVPTIIRYGESFGARVRFKSANWMDIPVSVTAEYVSEEENPGNEKGVSGLEIFAPNALLKTGMCLVDTPGLGSVHAGNTEATRAFIPHIDAAIVLIGADPPLSGDELELAHTVSQEVHELIFVLNKADRTSESERVEALAFARKVLEQRLGRPLSVIFQVSALERLENSGPSRDWAAFMQTLTSLVERSAGSLVRAAANRGTRRTADQLLAIVAEERTALQEPVEQSERRMAVLRSALLDAGRAMRDLGALLSSEQQRLAEIFAESRKQFLGGCATKARREFENALAQVAPGANGPRYRRALNHLAQNVAREELVPWLDSEAKRADEAFSKVVSRFAEMGTQFIERLRDTGLPDFAVLSEDCVSGRGLQAESHFYFHVMERVAAPASPLLLISDFLRGLLHLRGGIVNDGSEFLDYLLEVNSARVQSDVDDRVRESRRKLEANIKALLRETMAVAERALARAKAAQESGAAAVEAHLAKLSSLENEIIRLRD